MPWYFALDGNEIVTVGNSAVVPQGSQFVTVQNSHVQEHHDATTVMGSDGRGDKPEWDGSNVIIPPDTRTKFSIVADRANDSQLGFPVLDGDGVDSVTLTITKLLVDGVTTQVGFQGVRYLEIGERIIKLNFVAGVATKVIRTQKTGVFKIPSTPKYKLITPFELIIVE